MITCFRSILLIVVIATGLVSAKGSHEIVADLIEKLDGGARLGMADIRAAMDEYNQWELDDFKQIQRDTDELGAKVELLQIMFERIKRLTQAQMDDGSRGAAELMAIADLWRQLVPYFAKKSPVDNSLANQVDATVIRKLLDDIVKEDSQKLSEDQLRAAAEEYQQLEDRLAHMIETTDPGDARSMLEIRSLLSFKNQASVRILADIFFPIAGVGIEQSLLDSLRRIYKMELKSELQSDESARSLLS